MKKLVVYCPYPIDEAPSQRFRFEQYYPLLKEKGFKITVLPFYNQSFWNVLYKKGKIIYKIAHLFYSLIKRCLSLFYVLTANRVFIHREILPIGPPLFEWIISKVFRKKIIYDFDDAIWHTDNSSETRFSNLLRWRRKVALICRWSYKISCGNDYLADFAKQFNANVHVNPTTINTENYHIKPADGSIEYASHAKKRIVIGWTGSHSTLKYLTQIESTLNKLQELYSYLDFLVIADRKPQLKVLRCNYLPWRKKTEIQDLLKIDIGIMPLPDDEWTRGKCGFKVLQFMALEIPCLASPVGVNTKIIDHGVNGFICNTPEHWLRYAKELIESDSLRLQVGREGRKTVVNHYSVKSNSANFLSLFE